MRLEDFIFLFFFLKPFDGGLVSISSSCLINLSKSSSSFLSSRPIFEVFVVSLVLRLTLDLSPFKLPLGSIRLISFFGFSCFKTGVILAFPRSALILSFL